MRRNKQKALLLAALIGTVTVTSVIPTGCTPADPGASKPAETKDVTGEETGRQGSEGVTEEGAGKTGQEGSRGEMRKAPIVRPRSAPKRNPKPKSAGSR